MLGCLCNAETSSAHGLLRHTTRSSAFGANASSTLSCKQNSGSFMPGGVPRDQARARPRRELSILEISVVAQVNQIRVGSTVLFATDLRDFLSRFPPFFLGHILLPVRVFVAGEEISSSWTISGQGQKGVLRQLLGANVLLHQCHHIHARDWRRLLEPRFTF